jgi:putative intracellular protease/amidase
MKKALVVLTSVGKYPDMEPARATGLWLGEAVHFVKKIEEAGVEVDYVSPQGGCVFALQCCQSRD